MNKLWHMVRQEWRTQRVSFFWFTFGIWAAFTIFLLFFETFRANAIVLDELMKNFPPEFKAAFGLSDLPLSTINGYMSFVFSYTLLVGAVFGMKVGISALSEEGRSKTSDFLLTRPIKRHEVATAKLIGSVSLVLAQFVILSGILGIQLSQSGLEGIDFSLFFELLGAMTMVQLFFIGLGSLIAALLDRIKNPTPMTLGIVFFFFIVELVNQSLLDANLTYLTPFSYFKGSDLLAHGGYDPVYVLIDLAVFAGTVILSYWIFTRKDIHAV